MIGTLLLKLTLQTGPIQSIWTWWTTRPRGQAILILATAAWLVLGLAILLVVLVWNGVQYLWTAA